MCVACRARRAQRELLRIARTPEGVRVGPAARSPGRGAYVCPDPDCVERAVRRGGRALGRALRTDAAVGDEVAAVLRDALLAQVEQAQVQLQQAKEHSR